MNWSTRTFGNEDRLPRVPLPSLAILLVFLIARPQEAMPDVTSVCFHCLIAAVFGAALGFVQIYFDGHGDKRSLLLHRPLSRRRSRHRCGRDGPIAALQSP